MGLADSLLADEKIVFESKKHWMAPVRASLWAALMVIGFVVIRAISPNGDGIFGTLGSLMDLIGIGLLVGGIGWIVYNVVEWRTAQFAVTNMRVLREEGLASRRSSTTLLSSLSDVKTRVGFVGERLGYGDILVLTQSGEAGADRFTSITSPLEFRNAVMNQKMQDGRGQGGPAPSPVVTAAPVAPAAPAAPVAPAMSSTDAADTLARLADLRDRGAITAEDYEAKKTEILARM